MMLKLAMAVAVSFAGFLYSSYRTRRIGVHSPVSAEEDCIKAGIDVSGKMSSCCSSSNKEENYEDRFILPEFVDLIKEFESSDPHSDVSPIRVEITRGDEVYDDDDNESSIRQLRSTVGIHGGREGDSDFQFLEYHGLREMEAALMELQSRLQASEMEARLSDIRMKSLKAENSQLASQVAAHGKTAAELESATEQIEFLNKKIRSSAEENREHILMLQRRVMKLKETDRIVNGSYVERHRLKDAENTVEELRKLNAILQEENSDFSKRIEFAQSQPSPICDCSEVEGLKGENRKLEEEKGSLAKEVERLLMDRRADMEELVYLRWLNACFRYELRDRETRPGQPAATDMSKAWSPRSEVRVKRLVFEYSRSDPTLGFDPDQWSQSQASSVLTDSGDCGRASVRPSSITTTTARPSSARAKVLGRLKRLVRRRRRSRQRVSSEVWVPQL